MVRSAERKEHPISMRMPEADIAMIDRAAGLRGRSRTDFVRDAAVRAAEDVLLENRLIRMSPTGFDEFMAVLSGAAAPVPEMVELARRPAPWEPGAAKKR
ncbi:type II toxin-antitoxin system TacA family antitoxin [Inquilinus sp. OTU3971]|uniref:type II toxin-antitoxin system TacA family antitoxin n=1 Tax=Inquilinus sp. OTU3971 TaxID=3043855 RepID=UPI00313A8C89